MCITWDEPTAPFKQASGLYKHSPFRYMHAKNTICETTTAPKTWAKHRDNLTPLDGARQRIRAKTSQLTCEQGSPYDPTGVRHVPSHSDIAPRASWIVACQACRLSGFSGATQTPTSAVSQVHTVIDTAKRPRKLHAFHGRGTVVQLAILHLSRYCRSHALFARIGSKKLHSLLA